MWPTLTSGVDSHHDGLVIAIINSTKDSLLRGGEPPFNQYGPFWSVMYATLSLPFSPESTLIVARIITLTIYFLTAFYAFKITQLLKIPGLWMLVALLSLLTQPWTTGYGPTFLAWPSALSSFLLTFVTYQIVSSRGILLAKRQNILIGASICCMIFTRFQIGIATLFLTLLYFLFNRYRENFIFFLSSFLLSLSVALFFLNLFGWYQYFLFDSLEYSLTYIQDEFSVNPTPTFTILISAITFLTLMLLKRFSFSISAHQETSFSVLLYMLVALTNVVVLILLLRSPDFQEFLIRVFRRLWIGGFLGFALFVMVIFMYRIKNHKINDLLITQIWLVLYGGIGMIQLYPLFDPMHFWWGLFPLIIPLGAFFLNSLSNVKSVGTSFVFACLISIGLFTVLIPSAKNAYSEREIYSGGIFSLVRVSEKANLDQKILQDFFGRSIDPHSKVLNLCHNADVFFNSDLAKSSSRFFVYWPPFIRNSDINSEIIRSKPDIVVACSQTHIALATRETELIQLKILASIGIKTDAVDQLSLNGIDWKIFRG
jgi:hypothetical protein